MHFTMGSGGVRLRIWDAALREEEEEEEEEHSQREVMWRARGKGLGRPGGLSLQITNHGPASYETC